MTARQGTVFSGSGLLPSLVPAGTVLDRIDPNLISLGLDNVNAVKQALGCPPAFPVITVGGTNGKGSTCAMLEAILCAAGYRVGCYTSPHLLRFNERIRLNGRPASDRELGPVFARIEEARAGTPLTYFEFGTLAALEFFVGKRVDVAVLEVGLGGRLDAVNAFDADCAVITSIALDHMDVLGGTREEIAFEKAGIFRPHRPAVCSEPDVPATLRGHAAAIGARLLETGRDFGVERQAGRWQLVRADGRRMVLPAPALPGSHQFANASAAIVALQELDAALPVRAEHVGRGLLQARPAGRFQSVMTAPRVILDVAHNPHAARSLAENLQAFHGKGRIIAVFAMLKDKDIAGVVDAVKHRFDQWCVAPINEPRGAGAEELIGKLKDAGIAAPVAAFASVAAAYDAGRRSARADDTVVVFGSFRTVAAVLEQCGRDRTSPAERHAAAPVGA